MSLFTDLEGVCVPLCYSFKKEVSMGLTVLYLYRFCIIFVQPFNWLCYMFLT